MKVAIFEPHTRLCGVTKWSFEVAQGFRDLGHQGDVVSFTRSGRARKSGAKRFNGWYWWHEEPHVSDTWYKAGKLLDEYDFIILNEPKNGTEDREAARLGVEPFYIGALRRTKTPWMTILHAPQYDPQRAPHLEACLDAGNFTGTVVEHQVGSYESGDYAFNGRINRVSRWPWLPYRPTVVNDVVQTRTALVAGRSTPVKGHATMAAYGDRFPEGWVAEMAGSESGGQGAAYSYTIFETLTEKFGWAGHRPCREGKPSQGVDQYGNGADKLQAHPWWCMKDGHTVHYSGSYEDPRRLYSHAAVGLNLTAKSFAVGVEYSILEAMDAGCVVIAPAHCLDNAPGVGYLAYKLEHYTEPVRVNSKTGFLFLEPPAEQELMATVQAACQWVEQGYDPTHNRQVLDAVHAPRHLAQHILELMG